MRVAPFGLLWWGQPENAFQNAIEAAWTTHGHPSARYGSGGLAAIIARLANGEDLPTAVTGALALLETHSEAHEVRQALKQAVQLSALPNWHKRLPELGEGWVADEALAISVLCALAASDARQAIIAAVNHDGDSDSTGAIPGNLVGALYGHAALPSVWIEQLELRDVIETLASDLALVARDRSLTEDQAEELWERYPGW